MKKISALTFSLVLACLPAGAQDTNEEMREGMSLLQEGTRLFLQGLMLELGPMLLELEGKIVDLSAYHLPEILPNGDIIIRRKEPLELDSAGEVDL